MPFFVYMIIAYNKKKTISYVGYAKDVRKRIKLHNLSKGAKFTRGRKWSLIYTKKYYSKNKAMREEYKLKKNYYLRQKIVKSKIN